MPCSLHKLARKSLGEPHPREPKGLSLPSQPLYLPLWASLFIHLQEHKTQKLDCWQVGFSDPDTGFRAGDMPGTQESTGGAGV